MLAHADGYAVGVHGIVLLHIGDGVHDGDLAHPGVRIVTAAAGADPDARLLVRPGGIGTRLAVDPAGLPGQARPGVQGNLQRIAAVGSVFRRQPEDVDKNWPSIGERQVRTPLVIPAKGSLPERAQSRKYVRRLLQALQHRSRQVPGEVVRLGGKDGAQAPNGDQP